MRSAEFIGAFVGFFLVVGIIGYSAESMQNKSERNQFIQDSIIIEHHRGKRMLDWKSDSIKMEFEKTLRIVIDKANKYDSLMNLKYGRN